MDRRPRRNRVSSTARRRKHRSSSKGRRSDYDDEQRSSYTSILSSSRGTNRRVDRNVRFESEEEEEELDDYLSEASQYSQRARKRRQVEYPEPTSMQRRETILLFQDLRRKRRRRNDMNFVPDVPKEIIMGTRSYMEHEKRTRRISRRVERGLAVQEPITFVLERNKKGKLGVKMDRELNIIKVESFAVKCGASLGQKIIEFNGIPVVTKKDVVLAMQRTGGSKAKQCTLKVLYDPLAVTEIRADELSQLSCVKVPMGLESVPKLEDYQLVPSQPDRPIHTTFIPGKRLQLSRRLERTEIPNIVVVAPRELEVMRPVSPSHFDTPSAGHVRAECFLENEKMKFDDPICIHNAPLALDVNIFPAAGSPTTIVSPTKRHGRRQNVLPMCERTTRNDRRQNVLPTCERTTRNDSMDNIEERSIPRVYDNATDVESSRGGITTSIRSDLRSLKYSIQRARERIASAFAETHI